MRAATALLSAAGAGTAAAPVPQEVVDWCRVTDAAEAALRNATAAGVLEKALKGLTLQVGAMLEPPWLVHDPGADPGCASEWCSVADVPTARSAGPGRQLSGYDVDVMRRIAEYGEFTVQYHFEEQPSGWTWTDMLIGREGSNRTALIDLYDVIAGGGWVDSAARRKSDVHFTSSINDQGIVLAVRKPLVPAPTLWQQAWYWVQPLTGGAYVMVFLCAWIFPSLLVTVLEKLNNDDFADLPWGYMFLELLRKGILSIIGFGDFDWTAHWATRFIMLFWAGAVLILLTTYTANMTAFLVVAHRTAPEVRNIDEFMAKGWVACIPEGWGTNDPVRSRWPELKTVEVPAPDISQNIVDGVVCKGTLMAKGYLEVMLSGGPPRSDPPGCGGAARRRAQAAAARRAQVRPGSGVGGEAASPAAGVRRPECAEAGCELIIVGHTEVPLPGAFPAGRVDVRTCRAFPLQVINAIITSLAEQSELRAMFHKRLSAISVDEHGSPKCAPDDAKGTPSMRISERHMSGIIIAFCSPMLVLFLWGLAATLTRQRREAATRHAREARLRESTAMLDHAKQKFDELDLNRNGCLDGAELFRLTAYVDEVLREYTPMNAEDARGEEKRDRECAARLRERCASGEDVTWREFSGWFMRMRQAEWLETDPLESMKARDASSSSTSGQVVMIMDMLMQINDRLTRSEQIGLDTQKQLRSMRRERQIGGDRHPSPHMGPRLNVGSDLWCRASTGPASGGAGAASSQLLAAGSASCTHPDAPLPGIPIPSMPPAAGPGKSAKSLSLSIPKPKSLSIGAIQISPRQAPGPRRESAQHLTSDDSTGGRARGSPAYPAAPNP